MRLPLISSNNNFKSAPQTYYVSAAGSGNGTSGSPWGMSQFIAIMGTLPSGSTILFNKGDTFTNIEIDPVKEIHFDAYGTGANPIFTGSSDLSAATWTLDSGNIYYTVMASPPLWLFINDARAKLAETAYIAITSNSGSGTLIGALTATLNALNTTESLIGSIIVAKEWGFRPTYRNTISAYNTGTGVLTLPTSLQTDASGAGVGYSFKLMNHKSYISAVGDWMYDASTQRLYVKTSGSSPSGTNIKACFQNYGINIPSGVNNVSINNLEFTQYYVGAINAVTSNNLVINNCNIHDNTLSGIWVRGDSHNATVTNNTITNVGNNAIEIGGVMHGNFSYNTIHDIGTQPWLSFAYFTNWFRSVGCGIHARWDSQATIYTADDIKVEYNTIYNMAYCGIVPVGTHFNIQYNILHDCMQYWNDGGAIYMSGVYGLSLGHGSATNNNIIYHNLIYNMKGIGHSLDGVNPTPAIPLLLMGIYLDSEQTIATVKDNTITHCGYANIYINNNVTFVTISGNLCDDATVVNVAFRKQAFAGGSYLTCDGMTFTGNTLVNKNTAVYCVGVWDYDVASGSADYNPFGNGGASDNNKYINLNYDFINASFYGTNVGTTAEYGLLGWRARESTDVSSTVPIPRQFNYVSQVDADAKGLITINTTTSSASTTLNASNYYTDTNNLNITAVTVEGISGKIAFYSFAPDGPTLFSDQFTGSSVGIASHLPDYGNPNGLWTVDSGTSTIDGSGNLVASVAAELYQSTPGNPNVTIEITGQVSVDANLMNLMFRWTNSTTRITVSVKIDHTTIANDVITVINNGTTLFTSPNLGLLSLNTDYRLKVRVNAGRVLVWFTDASKGYNINMVDYTNAAIASNNSSGTNQGIRINTVTKITSCKIYGL